MSVMRDRLSPVTSCPVSSGRCLTAEPGPHGAENQPSSRAEPLSDGRVGRQPPPPACQSAPRQKPTAADTDIWRETGELAEAISTGFPGREKTVQRLWDVPQISITFVCSLYCLKCCLVDAYIYARTTWKM